MSDPDRVSVSLDPAAVLDAIGRMTADQLARLRLMLAKPCTPHPPMWVDMGGAGLEARLQAPRTDRPLGVP